VVTQWVDNHIQVLHAEEYIKPDFDDMLDITLGLTSKFGISLRDGCQIFVDGSAPEFIRSLKKQLGDQVDYEGQIDRIKKQFPGADWEGQMLVVPVHFAKEHRQMLAHCKKLMEYNNGQVAINPRLEGVLDKEQHTRFRQKK
jgi:hypothetical protein